LAARMPPTTLRNPNATIQQAGMLSAVQRWCISEYDRVLERHPWLPAMGVLWCSWCSAALYGTEELLSLAQLVPWLILAVTLLTLNVCEVQFQSLLKYASLPFALHLRPSLLLTGFLRLSPLSSMKFSYHFVVPCDACTDASRAKNVFYINRMSITYWYGTCTGIQLDDNKMVQSVE
jgi:hypothetical protein